MKTIFINNNTTQDELKHYVKELEDKEDFQTNNTGVIKTVYVNKNNFNEIFNDLIYSYNEDDYDLYIVVLNQFYNDDAIKELLYICYNNVKKLRNKNDFQVKTF